MIIGVDLLGGDLGAETTLPACRRFLEKNPNAELLVFTTRDVEVQPEPRLNVEYCESSIAMGDNVRQALKKKHSSTMGCCLAALSSGRVDGVLSLGNTGAYMALAMRIVGMSSEYSKTAICSAVPPFSSEYPIYMTDVGANVDCKPEDLLGFATMASREMCFANNPIRIGLLNVGHEDIKGSQLVKAAHQLLLDHQPNYIGYVEPKDIIAKKVNLVVTDGFNGNIYIKGISATTYHVMKHVLGKVKDSSIFGALGLGMTLSSIKNAVETFKGPFASAKWLGLNGVVVKCHGNASINDVVCGLGLAYDWIKLRVSEAA